MRNIREQFSNDDLSGYLNNTLNESVVGDFFKKTFNYLTGKVAQIGKYFVALFNGEPLPVMTPITSQVAWKNGDFNTKGVTWVGTKEDAKYSKVTTNAESVLKTRNSDTLAWWKSLNVNESLVDEADAYFQSINEDIKLANDDREIDSVDDDELKAEIRIRLQGYDVAPLLIWGAPGVGKTQIVKKVLKEVQGKNARLLDFQLSLKEHDDFFLPAYEVDSTGQKSAAIDLPKSYLPVYKTTKVVDGKTVPLTAEEIKAADADCGQGLIFLDELTQAKPSVQGVMLKFVQDRMLGEDYHLGSGWNIIAAANREADEVGAHEFNKALGNRFEQVNYEPTVKSWRKWADTKGYMNKHILDWLEQNEKYFYFAADSDTTAFASPRSWEAACRKLAVYAHTAEEEGFDLMDIPESLIRAAIARNCGKSVANAFMQYVKLIQTVDIESLKLALTDPKKAPLPKKEGKTYKVDLIYIYITTILSFLPADKLPTKEQFTNVCTYIARLGDESAGGNFFDKFIQKFKDKGCRRHFGEEHSESDMYLEGLTILVNAYPGIDADNPIQ